MSGHHHHCRRKTFWSRRDFLFQSGGGIAGLALADLLHRQGLVAAAARQSDTCAAPIPGNPFAPQAPHFEPRATAVISLFMSGGVSQVDTFDPKPALARHAGQPLADSVVVRQGHPGPLMPSPFAFQRHGESGIEVSEIFPHLARKVDEMAFIRSLYGRSNDHIQATYEMQSGQIRMGFPAVGSWVTYGLGSESASLPAYVVMNDHRGGPLGGPNDWSAGFMPATYQGTLFRAVGDPIVDLQPPDGMTAEQQRARLDTLAKLNALDLERNPGNSELAARISSYELAYRMQGCARKRSTLPPSRRQRRSSTGWTIRPRSRSAGSASWRGASWSGASGSCNSFTAGWASRTPIPGTRTATCRRTTRSTPQRPTCRLPAC